jgi:hypothetical protein
VSKNDEVVLHVPYRITVYPKNLKMTKCRLRYAFFFLKHRLNLCQSILRGLERLFVMYVS